MTIRRRGTDVRSYPLAYRRALSLSSRCLAARTGTAAPPARRNATPGDGADADFPGAGRSEEHTSELQSLMRSSYAVFCLKKKNILLEKNKIIINRNACRAI